VTAGSYVLVDAATVDPAVRAQTETGSRPRGTTGAASASKSYTLVAKAEPQPAVHDDGYPLVAKAGEPRPAEQDDNLSKHMNHKVEVTGTVSSSVAEASGAPMSSASPSTSSTGSQARETLYVTSFRMVSPTCP
jgi:hypothetical protein